MGRQAPARLMRAIFPMYDTPFQLLALQDTNIRSISDMADKRIGVGPPGGTSANYFPDIFNALKVKANFVFGDWADLASQIHARSIDVLAVAAGVPFPSFIELEFKDKVRYIALTPEQIAALRLTMPELTQSSVPAGTYPSLLRLIRQSGFTISPSRTPSCPTISSTISCGSSSRSMKR